VVVGAAVVGPAVVVGAAVVVVGAAVVVVVVVVVGAAVVVVVVVVVVGSAPLKTSVSLLMPVEKLPLFRTRLRSLYSVINTFFIWKTPYKKIS
jgi:hypothetical protein